MHLRLRSRPLLLPALALLTLAPGTALPGSAGILPATLAPGSARLPGYAPHPHILPAPAGLLGFLVTSTRDAPDAHPGDGICADAAGQCTLRAAVQEADAQPAGSNIAISVPAGMYVLTLGTLMFTSNVITITGALSGSTSVSGDTSSTVVTLSAGARAALSNLTLYEGNVNTSMGNGGGVNNSGRLLLSHDIVESNAAVNGGGIYNAAGGRLELLDSQVTNNIALEGSAAGIYNLGTLAISASTISANQGRSGGGVVNGGTLVVSDSTVSGNSSSGYGGGFINGGLLTLRADTVSGNSSGGDGGGIDNFGGRLSVAGSTISGNNAGMGGGLDNDTGTATVTGSTISGNSDGGSYYSGGIDNTGTLTLQSSTVSGNIDGGIDNGSTMPTGALTLVDSAVISNTTYFGGAGTGGGIRNFGALTTTNSTISGNDAGGLYNDSGGVARLTDSTISGNSDSFGGAGLYNYPPATLALTDTIVAGNSVPGSSDPDCSGALTSGGYNLLGIGDGCTGLANGVNGDQIGSSAHPLNARLSALQSNGGPTLTMRPLAGSPAIDVAPTGHCPLATDQRGLPRPDGGESQCDSGAVESQGVG